MNGRVITGRYNGVLNAGEALTVRLELPEGYFTATSYNPDFMTVASFALPVLLALLAVLIWTKYGRDEKAVETVEFYPPAGFNSAEVGFLYKGKAEANDAVSLMIYLANKGYIGIEEFEERSLFAKNKAFKLTKLKEYDGDNANERLFLTGLFNTPRMPKLSDIAGMLRSKIPPLIGPMRMEEPKSPHRICATPLCNGQPNRQKPQRETKQETVFEKVLWEKGFSSAC